MTLNETLSFSNIIAISQINNIKKKDLKILKINVYHVHYLKKFITNCEFTYKKNLSKTHCLGTENSNIAPQTHWLTLLKIKTIKNFFSLFGSL